jgi:hypothetical protein
MKRFAAVLCVLLMSCVDAAVDCESVGGTDIVSPDVSCRDFNPCTMDVYSPKYGCAHEQVVDGASCFVDANIGYCQYGLCLIDHDGWSDTVCDIASNKCYGSDPYRVKDIVGSCYAEWCNYDEPGRSIRPKPAGSPCVRAISEGSPEFVASQCGPCGECL